MDALFIKTLGPLVVILFWLLYALRIKSTPVALACLYFASFAAFSSNFTLVYREVHQLQQVFLIVAFGLTLLKQKALPGINRILLVFLLMILVSVLDAPIDADLRSQVVNFLAVIGVVNFLFFAVHDGRTIPLLAHFLACLTVLLALLGFAEIAMVRDIRIEATFSNPNYYGLFMGAGSCVILATWRGYPRIFASVLVLAAIILTGSRNAVAFPVLQMLWIAYESRRFTRTVTIVSGLVLAFFLVLNVGSTRYANVERLQLSDSERKIFATVALRMSKDNPLTGVGWGRFISEFGRYSTVAERNYNQRVYYEYAERRRRVTHNDYLRILAELGVVALLVSVGCALYGLWILWRRQGFGIRWLPPLYLGLLLFSLGHNNLNSAFFWFFFLIPFYLNTKSAVGAVNGEPAVPRMLPPRPEL